MTPRDVAERQAEEAQKVARERAALERAWVRAETAREYTRPLRYSRNEGPRGSFSSRP